jgi:phosphoribosyl-AMP cyclohydrolase
MSNLKFNEKGLIPAIAQDANTGEVLMLGYMNEEALRRTLSSGEVWFYSRSRQALWHKGETSGNRILVRSVWADCDGDTILVKAKPTGPVCHTGNQTCFFQQLTDKGVEASHQEED